MMKKSMISVITTLLFGVVCLAQTPDYPYEVGTWQGFTKTAINFTFDDGTSDHYTQVIPLFNEFDLKATFFLVTSWNPNWSAFKSAADQGHEIASHTVSHVNFSQVDLETENTQLKNSKDTIESRIPGQKCLTLAYPYCVKGEDTICSKYYIAARGCQGFMEPKTPGDFLNVSALTAGSLGINTVKSFKTTFENAAKTNNWCVFMIHATNGTSYSPLSIDTLRKSLVYLSVRLSKFWVTTFKNAALYAKERNAVNVAEESDSDTLKILSVTDNLDDSIFNYPLTIRRPLPADWPSADVTQDSVPVFSRIVQIDSTVFLMFDVVPDGGQVLLAKNDNYVVPEIDTLPVDPDTIHQVTAINQPFESDQGKTDLMIYTTDNNLVVSSKSMGESDIVVALFDLTGRRLFNQKVHIGADGLAYFNLSKYNIKRNLYVVKVSRKNNSWSKLISVDN